MQRFARKSAAGDVLEREANLIAQRIARAPVPHTVSSHSSGSSLDPSTRQFMEGHFGHDFARVRVHTDASAAAAARSLNALAFTSREDITFAAGQFAPTTARGQRLLAHELSHVVQQWRGESTGVQRQEAAAQPEASPASSVSGADSVTVTFGPEADATTVKPGTLTIIKEIVANAGLTSCMITSTARTPEDQARAMYDNIEKYGVDAQKKLYAAAGDKVIDVYVASKAAKKASADIQSDMVAKINELGPSTVSKHCADWNVLCVVDIAPSSISNKTKFIAAFEGDARVTKSLKPPDDPAYHLEIPQ